MLPGGSGSVIMASEPYRCGYRIRHGLIDLPPVAALSLWRLADAQGPMEFVRGCGLRDVANDHRRPAATPLRRPWDAIAHRVVWTSQYAFAHAFKRHYGSPPGSYRRQAG